MPYTNIYLSLFDQLGCGILELGDLLSQLVNPSASIMINLKTTNVTLQLRQDEPQENTFSTAAVTLSIA